jgi:predicted transcriptional regulator
MDEIFLLSNERKIIDMLIREGQLDVRQLARALTLSVRDMDILLEQLVTYGFVRTERNGKYYVTQLGRKQIN